MVTIKNRDRCCGFRAASGLSAAANFANTQTPAPSTLQAAFDQAAAEFDVPSELLLALSYNLSRWEQHSGQPSTSGGYGVMHLTQIDLSAWQTSKGLDWATPFKQPAEFQTLARAARLIDQPTSALINDPVQNIRGGAALLAEYSRSINPTLPTNLSDWYGAVVLFSGSKERSTAFAFADRVYATVQQGASRRLENGEQLSLAPSAVTLNRQSAANLPLLEGDDFPVDCPATLDCEVVPAAYALNDPNNRGNYGNYDLANRPVDGLDYRYILIHDTEITYTQTINVFQNPLTKASTHYVVRASDGHIAQMVENKNVPWHAGNWDVNGHAIGLEHEGYAIEGASWYSEAMYQASARLTRYLADKYQIPLDRSHIIGHDELPGPLPQHQAGMHWDPGPFWDWAHYMDLVRGGPAQMSNPDPQLVTINPDFATNMPAMTYCYTSNDCRAVPTQSANFVYLHTQPNANSPLITNQYIGSTPTHANNWANKAVTGQTYVAAGQQDAWQAIYFGSQKAWFHNPNGVNSTAGQGLKVRPKVGQASIPVYGRAYPEAAAYPQGITPQAITPIYTLPADNVVVATKLYTSTYYSSPVYTPTLDPRSHVVVSGQTKYYQINFNHRFGFVKASDVEVQSSVLSLTTPQTEQGSISGNSITYTLTLRNLSQQTVPISLSLTGNTWPTTLTSAVPSNLGPNASQTITLRVDLPAGQNLSSDQVWVKAQTNADQQRSAVLLLRSRLGLPTFLPVVGK
ncbi:N-acetylmuramoyl-L-alanine amidase [Herpetosiphon sp. NSE202]|uniref:N-acetylmuramoyl-L-alanine amidase n=1 Tax=Herpetosiphon sp. NSE202 TaxID=3351349 RepID=UPI003637A0A6